MKKVYIAGPDVFRTDAIAHGKHLVSLCEMCGIIGLYPMDNVILGDDPFDVAVQIQKANVQMIRDADAVIANISPFRGPGADNGTAYEIGFAEALGKPVYLYSDTHSVYKERVPHSNINGNILDNNKLTVEDFGLIDNLMFGIHPVHRDFSSALAKYIKDNGVE